MEGGAPADIYGFSMWSRAVEYNIANELTARGIKKDCGDIKLIRELKKGDTLILAVVKDSSGEWKEVCKKTLKELIDFDLGGDICITPKFEGYDVMVRGKGLLIPIKDINESLKLAGITHLNETITYIAGYINNKLRRHRIV